jgi:putative ABC transport system permease protein
METLWQDVRYGLRLLATRPGFAAIAILTLALGIGANITIFGLMNVLLLKSLPVWHPEELVQVTGGETNAFSNPIWEEFRDHEDIFSGAFAWGSPRFNLADAGQARYASGLWVSGEFFSTLGVQPVLGRTLTASDDKPGATPAAVLNYAFWQSEYGGRPDVIGQTIHLDGHSFTIAGVTPPEFFGVEVGRRFDVAVPIADEPLLAGEFSKLHRTSNWWLNVIARPKPGVSINQVNARLKLLSPQIFAATVPPQWKEPARSSYLTRVMTASPAAGGVSYLRDRYRQALTLLLGVSALVLLIACANVANLLLARAASRQKEIAVRLAVGASRKRLVRQLLTENLLVGIAGSALGLLLAAWASRLLVAQISTPASPLFFDLSADLHVAEFAIAAAVLTTLLFGLAPVWRATGVSLNAAMKSGESDLADRRAKFGLGSALVVAQVCISVVLVAGAGLLLETFRNLLTLDPGFASAHILVVNLDLRKSPAVKDQRTAVYSAILDRVRATPGVVAASLADVSPLSGSSSTTFVSAESGISRHSFSTYANIISSEYFNSMSTQFVAGRDFDRRDTLGSPKVAIINEALSRKLFGDENPVGKTFRESGTESPREIIGLVKDAKYRSLREEMPATFYTAFSQDVLPDVYSILEVRSAGSPRTLIPAISQAISQASPETSFSAGVLAEQLGQSLVRERLLASLSGVFGALALLLSALGLYGLISYGVARRRRELGIRIALGASRTNIFRLVLREGAGLAAGGIAAGIVCAVFSGRLLKSFLYGVAPRDPFTLFGVSALLLTVAVVACCIPARRATAVDPAAALRAD